VVPGFVGEHTAGGPAIDVAGVRRPYPWR
jgi:hypothetical protein